MEETNHDRETKSEMWMRTLTDRVLRWMASLSEEDYLQKKDEYEASEKQSEEDQD